MHRDEASVLALGAVFEALGEVRSIAEKGQHDNERLRTCLSGLLGQYDGDVAALYGGAASLHSGLRLLADHLGQPQNMHLTRYLVGVMQLERRLRQNKQALSALIEGLEKSRRQADYFGSLTHDNVLYGLAEVYAQSVSPLRPRILVQGHAQYLQDERNAAMIRCLLLAAIRAAGLWQLNGGGRIKLVFGRRRIIATAQALSERVSA